ncbi:MAG: phage holin family protein [Tabrizicola sp.]|jgi:hypothetical protein|nr:phage holin family protein [Tabrizicola sp.]
MIGGPDPSRPGDAATLMSEAVASLGRLVRGELRLARAEAAESARSAGASLVKMAIALVALLVGLNVLATAAVAGLVAAGIGPGAAGLIVALVLLGLAVGLAASARTALRAVGLWPRRLMSNLEKDAHALRAGLAAKGNGHV